MKQRLGTISTHHLGSRLYKPPEPYASSLWSSGNMASSYDPANALGMVSTGIHCSRESASTLARPMQQPFRWPSTPAEICDSGVMPMSKHSEASGQCLMAYLHVDPGSGCGCAGAGAGGIWRDDWRNPGNIPDQATLLWVWVMRNPTSDPSKALGAICSQYGVVREITTSVVPVLYVSSVLYCPDYEITFHSLSPSSICS